MSSPVLDIRGLSVSYATPRGRSQGRDALVREMDAIFATATLAEWRERMLPNDPSARRRWADRAIRALDRLDG